MNTWYGTPQIESWLARQGQAAHRQSRWSREKITDQDDEQVSQMMAQHRTVLQCRGSTVPQPTVRPYPLLCFSFLSPGHWAPGIKQWGNKAGYSD